MKIKLFIIIFILFSQATGLCYSLPLPPNTIKEEEERVKLNDMRYITEVYRIPLSPEEAASFYREKLNAEGFILISENETLNTLIFHHPKTKDNFSLMIQDRGEGSIYLNVAYWKGGLVRPKKDLTGILDTDSPGRDLPNIPRYPGSIRITSIEIGQMRNASYRTSSSKEEIIAFYKSQMPNYGWERNKIDSLAKEKAFELLQERALAEGEFLLFEKKRSFCGILVSRISSRGRSQGGCCQGSSQVKLNIPEGNLVSIILMPK